MRDEEGALTLPCLLALVALAVGGWGTWGILRHWRFQAETQLRLDRCVADKARELKKLVGLLEASNKRMEIERLAIPVAILTGTEEVRQAILRAELVFQEAARAQWNVRRLAWMVKGDCGDRADRPLRLSSIDWERLPEDPVGPQPFRWKEEPPSFVIMVRSGSRTSAGRISKGEKDEWSANWIPGLPRPGLR